jgi:hypothetical protein
MIMSRLNQFIKKKSKNFARNVENKDVTKNGNAVLYGWNNSAHCHSMVGETNETDIRLTTNVIFDSVSSDNSSDRTTLSKIKFVVSRMPVSLVSPLGCVIFFYEPQPRVIFVNCNTRRFSGSEF